MVVTPRKWPGRERPSSLPLSSSTVTQVTAPCGYISSTEGAKSRSTPSLSSSARSCSNGRGYFAKSSLGPNCVGFTKIDAATTWHAALAARISARWPSCRAPMVGTRPRRSPLRRAMRDALRMVSMVGQIFMGGHESLVVGHSPFLLSRSCARQRLISRLGRRHPVDLDVRPLQCACDRAAIPAQSYLLLLRATWRFLHQNRSHAAKGPSRPRQVSQRVQNFSRLKDLFLVSRNAGQQTDIVGADDEVGILPIFLFSRVGILRWVGSRDILQHHDRVRRRCVRLGGTCAQRNARGQCANQLCSPARSQFISASSSASLQCSRDVHRNVHSKPRKHQRTIMGTSVFTAHTSATTHPIIVHPRNRFSRGSP